jgi:hypothetical protein
VKETKNSTKPKDLNHFHHIHSSPPIFYFYVHETPQPKTKHEERKEEKNQKRSQPLTGTHEGKIPGLKNKKPTLIGLFFSFWGKALCPPFNNLGSLLNRYPTPSFLPFLFFFLLEFAFFVCCVLG